jgi:outer membrane lipoprotein-sorting protein
MSKTVPFHLASGAAGVTLAGAALVAGPAIAGAIAPRDSVITPEKILRAQDTLTYTGLLLINDKQRVQVTHGGGHQKRQAFFTPKGELSDLMVSDGRIRWHYAPRLKLVRLMPMDEEVSIKRRLALVDKNYRFQVMGQAKKAGRLVVLTRFLPKNQGNMTHMLWVDPSTYLPLAVERRTGDGRLLDRSEYLRIKYRPKLAAKVFQFSIPEGSKVQSPMTMLAHGDASLAPPATLGFRPPIAKVLPPGYTLVGWKYFQSNRDVPTFNWRFHDGLNSLSLFAVKERHQPAPKPEAKVLEFDSGRAFLATHGPNRMLMWKANAIGYTLVGHVPEEEMLKVARSTF